MAKKFFTDESLATFVDEIKSYTDDAVSTKANSSHNHAASNITSGTLSSDRLPTVPIAKGGTGATTAAAALTNLGLTATAAELNKLDGVTATTAELNYIDGVTSNIQTQLNAKQATITGAATTITGSNLTANRALVSNGSGKVAVSAVTSTELGYLDGVTSSVQTQLDSIKSGYLPLSGGTVTGTTVFSKVQDTAADSYNAPAVVIGGEPTTYHLELDNNEIQSKLSETKAGNLFLNSNGGVVHVGFDGLKMDSESSIIPEYAISGNVGTAELPFNKMYGRYHYIYGGENAEYGNLRVGTTGTTSTAGVATLQLGNNIAAGTAHNASGKITMYGSGTAFTNIMPSDRTSGSNAVKLPSNSGTLALAETSTKVATMTTSEYNALTTEQVDANTLYMLTDSEDEEEDFSSTAFYVDAKFYGDGKITIDKTVNEIESAYQSGREIVCNYSSAIYTVGMVFRLRLINRVSENDWIFGGNSIASECYFKVRITDETATENLTTFAIDTDIPDKLPNPNKLTINGVSYDGSSAKSMELAKKTQGVFYIVGDSTTSGVWTGTSNEITEYFEGLTILYKNNVAGISGGTTLNINNLGAVSVRRNASTEITTTYPVGSVIMFTYTTTDGVGYWLTADYDANTKTTTGTSNKASTKLFLTGATSQTSSGTTTYSNKNCYIGTDNRLYSGGAVVPNLDEIAMLITEQLGVIENGSY